VTDAQLHPAIGIPSFALILGMIGNGLLFNALSARMIMGKLGDPDTRLSVLEDRSKRS